MKTPRKPGLQPTTTERGYGAAWQQLRLHALKRDRGLCQSCARQGRVTLAREVDHVIPKAKGGPDVISNLQSLCSPCHAAKTVTDAGMTWRPTVRADGWPDEAPTYAPPT